MATVVVENDIVTVIEVDDNTIEIVEVGAQGPAGFGLISGGTTNQALTKASDADHDVQWTTITGLSDENVKVSSNDTTAGYLNGKLVGGTGVTLVEGNDGGNETLTINITDNDTTDHTLLSNIGTNTHVQIDSHIADSTVHFTQAAISITKSQVSDLGAVLYDITSESIGDLSDVVITTVADNELLAYQTGNWINKTFAELGLATSGDLTSHTGDATIHFTEASINHANITGVGTNTHAQIDTHIANSGIHITDHTALSNIGTNTHAQIDSHIADATLHFTQASIDHTAIANVGTNTHAQIDSHIANTSNPHSVTKAQVLSGDLIVDADVDANAAIDRSKISTSVIGSPTINTLEEFISATGGSGMLSGFGFTDNLDGTVAIAAGTVLIRATDDDTAELLVADIGATASLALTDQVLNHIFVDYNAGSPQFVALSSHSTDINTKVHIGHIYRDGTDLHMTPSTRFEVDNFAGRMSWRMYKTEEMLRESGAIISETGTRNFAITAGNWWNGVTQYTTAAQDTSVADTFRYYYRDGVGGWTEVIGQTQINNTQYDDGSGTLASLSGSRYGDHWLYIGTDGDLYVIYGQGNYTLSDALDTQPPSSHPGHFNHHATLVGKIIIQNGASTFHSIESTFGSVFTGAGTTDHGELVGLTDDDHTQYLLADGTRTLTGNLVITGTVDGRDVALDGTNQDNHIALVNEHIDWTLDQGATNIHPGNYTDTDTTDHTLLTNIGTNTHAQIDTHIADATKHRIINDAGTSATELWSASKISTELAGKSSTSHTHAVNDLSDVNAPTPTDNQALIWNSGAGEWQAQNQTGAGLPEDDVIALIVALS